ncbi:hypothetical protein LZD49_24280 [Dyadobacter sp. CY261]|uniref:hypothetical protein n=1 Tax=Dyadobacter sp. CY261 TaxID=2907203 RepID=UPI001F21450D|nr:hypothetical protein [Dyadobacter sp. CY261]MCF0073619.1 hypothetical protein [Dyadobacter sp. CY261]
MTTLAQPSQSLSKKISTSLGALRFSTLQILGFLLVVAGAILINYNYLNRLDIISDDDDLYFSFGMMLLKGKYRGADDGPLYYGFQLLLQLITDDAIQTFYINYIVTTTIPIILFYLLLRARNINVWLAVWLSLMFMFSSLNYPLTPKLTHYAIIFLLLGLLAFTYAEDLVRKFFYCSLFTLLAAYARPELYIACFLLSVVTVFICFRAKKWGYIVAIVAIIVAAGYLLGTPIGARDRSFWTFKHHFSINYIEVHPGLNLSPWNHFNQITTSAFGHKLTSIKDAILSNPQMVFWHVKTNIIRYAGLIPHYLKDIIFDSIQFPFRKYVLFAMGVAVLFRMNYRQSWMNIVSAFKRNALFLIVFLIILLPTFISNFFIYPRPHYVLYHLFLYLYVLALLCNGIELKKYPAGYANWPKLALLCGNLIFIILLFIPKYKENIQSKPLPSKNFALMLQKCNIKGPVSALGGDAPFSYNRYVGLDWTFHYYDIIRPKNFAKCLADYKVNCVIINDKMNGYFLKDASYHNFLAHPESKGFLLIKETPSHKVFARKDLI